MNEGGINMRWGLMSLVGFFLIGLSFLHLMQPWEELLENAKTNVMLNLYDDHSEGDDVEAQQDISEDTDGDSFTINCP
eukprot:CAMPEP_0172514412 /NCGR_PEP_ID=MMETSP1066-20121228/259889_1 /TAXON_ID=671091 /ORGANISM="Coscinodiscus wailesii, Strain CCMP2513" /LENGTH=77 /DNA_ID=CAMNT_0013295063 /DNA_START=498 /DNA_END=727 /DNA_ORIENTATION=-